MDLDSITMLATATDVSTGNYVCNPKIDFDCNGLIESWERIDDAPPVIYGSMNMIVLALAIYSYFGDKFYENYGFNFA